MENQILLYNNAEGNVTVKVTYLNDTFWLPQKLIAQLFGVEVPAISKHLRKMSILESNRIEPIYRI